MKKNLKRLLYIVIALVIIYFVYIFIESNRTIDFSSINYPENSSANEVITIYEEDKLLYTMEIKRTERNVYSTVYIKPFKHIVCYEQNYFTDSTLSNQELMIDLGWAFRNGTLKEILNPIHWLY